MTKNHITIEQFINKSLGEWKAIRNTHTLAFQEFENSTSKISIKNLETKNKKVVELLKKYKINSDSYFVAISICWQALSDWEEIRYVKKIELLYYFYLKTKIQVWFYEAMVIPNL